MYIRTIARKKKSPKIPPFLTDHREDAGSEETIENHRLVSAFLREWELRVMFSGYPSEQTVLHYGCN